ncbi:MAG: phosphatase PAP2 family protein [Phocaeicola sp.]
MRKQTLLFVLLLGLITQVVYAGRADSLHYLVPPHYASRNSEKQVISPEKPFRAKQSFRENFSWMGVGLVATGLVFTAQNSDFRNLPHNFTPHLGSRIEDYTLYAPLAATYVLKLAGVQNRSSWSRMLVSNALSAATMGVVVKSMKATIHEVRPDKTSANSFPSGHTATAFLSASILHKEYGDRSPWYTVAGYTVATATGAARILNNHHWVNDVLVGAGIGILSTELGYFLGDLLFKEKGITRFQNATRSVDLSTRPSFINWGVQVGIGPSSLQTPEVYDAYDAHLNPTADAHSLHLNLKLGTSASLSVEGAYFLTNHWGIGGRLRATATPVIAETNADEGFRYHFFDASNSGETTNFQGVESSHLTTYDLSIGGYYSYPIHPKMLLGTKLLVGNRFTPSYHLSAFYEQSSEATLSSTHAEYPNFVTIDAANSMTWGTGLSLNYAFKANTSFRFSVDYDYTAPEYLYKISNRMDKNGVIEDHFKRRTTLHNLQVGLGMAYHF